MQTKPTKLARLRAFMAAGAWDRALALAARFPRLGAQGDAIRRGHEAAARPDFYRQIGRDPAALLAAGIAALQARYAVTGENGAQARSSDRPDAESPAKRPTRHNASVRVVTARAGTGGDHAGS